MKAFFVWLLLSIYCSASFAQSIDPVSLVIAKVIKAIDLKVQQLQNETIWLQHAQQVVEHALSKTKLTEIGDWQRKQEALYANYFAELKQVKVSIPAMSQVKRIIEMQRHVMDEYSRLAKDARIKPAYDLLLSGSFSIVSTLQIVIGSAASMKDAERISLITTLHDAMNQCLENIRALNLKNFLMAAGEKRMQADLRFIKRLNGLP